MSDVLAASSSTATAAPAQTVVLTGNPNCGKTTLFNALTGLRAKVGNYAGVTVERKEGRLQGSPKNRPILVLDLPGTYSLSPQSLDEQIARDVLFHRLPEVPSPGLVVVVVDGSNLQRNLYFATQVIELGYPTLVALNMIDVAEENGHTIDAELLAQELGVPVYPLVANSGRGVKALTAALMRPPEQPPQERPSFVDLPAALRQETKQLADVLSATFPQARFHATAEALLLLSDERFANAGTAHYPKEVPAAVAAARTRLEAEGIDWRSAAIEARYTRISALQQRVTTETAVAQDTLSDRLDRVFTHRLWGVAIFVVLLTTIFQSIFTFAKLPQGWMQNGVDLLGRWVSGMLAPGPLNELLVKGVIAGVGAVVVFLPQICLLFFFIGLLEDTGYMARAAFLMDRLMSRVGLHGKSFIPMLSSFACAIPGIMATRTIESPKDRLVTILVAPLMSCSARLPVYTVLIAACIPDRRLFGILKWQGLTMLAMYLLGIVVALAMAWLFKKTLLKGPTPMLIMELPPYKRPLLRTVLRQMWDRSKLFLRRAGTVILGINILLWFLASYPKSAEVTRQFETRRAAIQAAPPAKPPAELLAAQQLQLDELDKLEAGERLRQSYAGRLGRLLAPAIEPLGFDWKIGIGIVTSFAAREVFVSTMSLVYNVGESDKSEAATRTLAETLRAQRNESGQVVFTPLVAVTLMVFYVFALQCVSTVAVVRRETNAWKWPLFQWLYMGALAWILAFICYQGGRLLKLG